MKKDYSWDEEIPLDLKYGEIYNFENGIPAVYIGNDLNGMGRILYRVGDKPVILSFNLRKTKLEGKVLNAKKFSNLPLNDKESSFALEILTKKGL